MIFVIWPKGSCCSLLHRVWGSSFSFHLSLRHYSWPFSLLFGFPQHYLETIFFCLQQHFHRRKYCSVFEIDENTHITFFWDFFKVVWAKQAGNIWNQLRASNTRVLTKLKIWSSLLIWYSCNCRNEWFMFATGEAVVNSWWLKYNLSTKTTVRAMKMH